MSDKRRKYTPEFREQAAHLVIETGRPMAHVAAEIGMGEQVLARWVRLQRLRRENAELRLEREFLKKAAIYPIKRMCALLGVSRSGFYRWSARRGRGPTPLEQRRAELDAKVAASHTASDGVRRTARSGRFAGAGQTVSRKTVAASLRRQGLAGISPRRFAPATTVVDLDVAVPKDLVGRRFDTGALNRVWTSDITYLRTGQRWLYLCAVRDGCSRRVIGWRSTSTCTPTWSSPLAMAVAMRGELAKQVILHADYAGVCVKPRICRDGLAWWGGVG